MKYSRNLYGLMGLLSLLGFIGVFTEEKLFLCFFAFVFDFQYFFIKSDEMLEAYMNKSAALAFYSGMVATAVVAVVYFFVGDQNGYEALLLGFAVGWGASVVVHSLSTIYYKFREAGGLEDDKK